MSKKHKKKARAAKIKPHTVKEANRRKKLRDNLKAKRVATKTKQCSKNTSASAGVEVNVSTIHRNETSSANGEDSTRQTSTSNERT
mmetsp:Transcript_12208/g.25192  ORF Transcript_12208/g.25192 Transcript_12208/m.25192 type:complete len:86 (+) Transcript_12208:26-283(+)|eukprot:CAMPEP_0197278112 /NCGR_PEP_ID=MMETSP1432-20130617/18123_1 /TAXON_ID=44447 /ORGANISM="Pseudo-nitzschia delicatissima, Strain UNC1205" /LENGTH=85 /DNA_ID=CAMNT_0042744437 /DNA_START=38 /DNA_END=295 /DNA_ORIENTATION=+